MATDAGTFSGAVPATRVHMEPVSSQVAIREFAGLVLLIAVVAVGLGSLTTLVSVPSVFGDELSYWEAARSVASGDGFSIRGGGYGYGPLYPALLAPIVGLLASPDAYVTAKLLNAALFASAGVPIYLLSRRFVGHVWSLVVTTLALIAPSAAYTAFILTESLAFVATSWAFLAVVLALETPSVRRQGVALALVLGVAAVRPQLVVLGLALFVAYVARTLMLQGAERAAYARRLAPTWAAGGLVAVAAAVWAVVAGSGVLGAYAVLASTNVPLAKAVVWSWWTAGALAVGLAAVPAIVCPAIIAGLRRHARQGSQLHAAFLTALLTMNAAIIVSVGIFASTRWGNGVLHERYFFYLVPLWLIAIAVWCHDGLAATRRQLVIGLLLAFCLIATLPPGLWTTHATVWLQWPSSTAWALLEAFTPIDGPAVSPVVAVVLISVGFAALLVARRNPLLAIVPIAVVFAAGFTLTWSWRIALSHLDQDAYGANAQRTWIDAAVGPRDTVSTFFPGSERCLELNWIRSMLYSEFANGSVGPAFHMREASAPVIASTRVFVQRDGAMLDAEGRPVIADFILAPLGVEIVGRRVAASPDGLVTLWHTSGRFRVRAASTPADVFRTACPFREDVA